MGPSLGDVRRRGSRGRHRSRVSHSDSCQASSSSRRCSGRSGSRSGTSRRSTSRPPRPPPTSTANRRPRTPSRTASRKWNSAVATSPGGRSTSSRPPGTRSLSVAPVPAWTVRRPALAPARIPAGMTTLPSGLRTSSTRSSERLAPLERIGDHPEHAEEPGVVLGDRDRGGPAEDVGDREGHGRSRGGGEGAAADDHEVRRREGGLGGRRLDEDAERGPGRGEPEARPVARDRRPRPESQLAEPVAEAVAVDRDRRPGQDAIDGDVAGVRRDEAGVGDDRDLGRRFLAARSRAGRGPEPAVEADLDQLDPPIEDVGEGGRHPAGRAPRVVGAATDLVEQLPQRLPGGLAGAGGRREEQLARALAGLGARLRSGTAGRPSPRPGSPSAPAGERRPRSRPRSARRARAVRRRRVDRPRPRGGRRRPDRGACG